MKTLYMIGGPMGVGKTAVCRELQLRLPRCVFLDGDWCWDARPFQVTEETKAMVLRNIRFLLEQFIGCSAYENIVFCWVMHEQTILDAVADGLDAADLEIRKISLACDAQTLRERLQADIDAGKRSPDVIERSLARLPLYGRLDTVKIGTDGRSPAEIAQQIIAY